MYHICTPGKVNLLFIGISTCKTLYTHDLKFWIKYRFVKIWNTKSFEDITNKITLFVHRRYGRNHITIIEICLNGTLYVMIAR